MVDHGGKGVGVNPRYNLIIRAGHKQSGANGIIPKREKPRTHGRDLEICGCKMERCKVKSRYSTCVLPISEKTKHWLITSNYYPKCSMYGLFTYIWVV